MSRKTYRSELVSRIEPPAEHWVEPPWHHSRRARLFGLTFFLSLLSGLAWTALQPPEYRSVATVLMSAPTAIDVKADDADIQNVAIQRKILLGSPIIGRIAKDLDRSQNQSPSIGELRGMLSVEPVPQTNMVELIAAGSNGKLLPTLVSTWLDAYLEVRAEETAKSKSQTLDVVGDELAGLGVKIREAREALDQHRRANNIISAQREENEVLSRLEGLNNALNNAMEEEVKTGAHLQTLQDALEKGKLVVPSAEQPRVAALEVELRELRKEIAELSKRYTMEYINKQPRMRAVIERSQELESELAVILAAGSETELAVARQNYSAAQQSVLRLQEKLEIHRRRVADFTRIYATHEALVDDLERLEELNREALARQVQVQVRDLDKYPQVSIIQRPADLSERVGPDYLILSAGALLGAFVLGIVGVWLYGFLGHPATPVPMGSVHLHPPQGVDGLEYSRQVEARLASSESPRLGTTGEVDPDQQA